MFKMVENQWTLALKIQIQISFEILYCRCKNLFLFKMFAEPYDTLGLLEDCVKMLDVQILTRPSMCLKFGFASC